MVNISKLLIITLVFSCLSVTDLQADSFNQLYPVKDYSFDFLIPKKKKDEKSFRRAEIIFFISLPFTILYSRMATEYSDRIFRYPYSPSWRDKPLFGRSEFFFAHHKRKFVLYNCVLWSASIALNDYVENYREGNREKLKTRTDKYRQDLNFFTSDL